MATDQDFDAFVHGYECCILWAETEDGSEFSLQDMGREFSADALDQIVRDCREFWDKAAALVAGEHGKTPEDAGHDFWLTRNGHGAGFWDGDWPVNGERLDALAKDAGEIWAYVGDDLLVYFTR